MNENKSLRLFYFQITDIWKRFCEEHSELLDKTFEEYSLLLTSDIDTLEPLLKEKAEVVQRITFLEKARQRCIDQLNDFLSAEGIKTVDSVSELIQVMSEYEEHNNEKHLFRFNQLLIDIIEKIQAQNKKNQLFLNRSINNLREIREDALGEKNYNTYNNKGLSSRASR
jgi:flagellar biosynthesis/type III secretory pathway chaperone